MSGFDFADFYRRRLKRFPAIRAAKEMVWTARWALRWRVVYPVLRTAKRFARSVLPAPALRFYHRATGGGVGALLRRWREPPRLLVGQAVSAPYGGRIGIQEIFPACLVQVEPPPAFPPSSRNVVGAPPRSYVFPRVVLSEWSDVEVVGRSNLLRANNALIHHDLFRPSHDYTSEELHGRLHIDPYNGRAWCPRQAAAREFERAALFTDAIAPNYAHWLTEVVPRLHAYGLAGAGAKSVVLLDAGLHPNLLHSARLMLPADAAIAELAVGEVVRVHELQAVSPTGYIPFEPRPGVRHGHSHGVFSAPALLSMREHLAQRLGQAPAGLPRRILLRRNSSYRAMRNEEELQERLAPFGFVPVYPERLSFAEQFHLFSGAELVVGATGAAMANLLFCPPQARIVICLSAHPDHSFGYWQNIAAAVGNRVSYVLGEIAGQRGAGVHADFRVEPNDVMIAAGLR